MSVMHLYATNCSNDVCGEYRDKRELEKISREVSTWNAEFIPTYIHLE